LSYGTRSCDLYVCGGRSVDRNLDVDVSNYVIMYV
jgi:hypothetical protein